MHIFRFLVIVFIYCYIQQRHTSGGSCYWTQLISLSRSCRHFMSMWPKMPDAA